MTYYWKTINGNSQLFRGSEVLDENSLEGVAVLVKRKKQELDALSAQRQLLVEKLDTLHDNQATASKEYSELKKKLVELANEIEDKEEKDDK